MFRLLRAWLAKISGFFGSKADQMQSDPHVMAQTYDAAIDGKEASFDTVKNSVASLIGMKTKKIKEIQSLTEKTNKYSLIKASAQAKLKQRAEQIVAQCKMEGTATKPEVQSRISFDADYLRHQGAFNDASSSLNTATEDIDRKESELESLEKKIAIHKTQLTRFQNNIKDLVAEKHDSIAQTQLAKEMEAVDAAIAGVVTSKEDKDLQAAREARDRAIARSEITSELAGTDAQLAEDEYLEYASTLEANNELEGLIDLDSMLGEESDLNPAKLPE